MTKAAPSLSRAKALLVREHNKLTPFQHKVLVALCEVPEGRVTTYKYLAKRVGCRSNQAVGQALKRNPFAPTVPCHRVVAQSGKIGGFGGSRTGTEIDKKISMLKGEGVRFLGEDNQGVIDPSCMYTFE